MMHHFDPRVAQMVGVNAAVIYQAITWWCEKNRANERNFRDGRYWTHNSISAWCKLFPYLTRDQIRRALEKLEEHGLIVSGNYNREGYDRTKWYSSQPFGTDAKWSWQNCQMDLATTPNGFGTDAKPIPVNNPVNNPVRERDAHARDDPRNADPAESDRLFDRVLAAAGVSFGSGLSTYWLPPGAMTHIEGWKSLGLTDDEIVQVVQETRARFTDQPRGPKAFDVAMKQAARDKASRKDRPMSQSEFFRRILEDDMRKLIAAGEDPKEVRKVLGL